ncbi:unnamed protein product [Mesocestoides corti]|uniref:Dynein light chain n=1 Tax=Mesocestoides corti TaxID=53468 RepID=A0A0R3UA13_MESCO|nr:unnamed protein product [Mesocestoides corti]
MATNTRTAFPQDMEETFSDVFMVERTDVNVADRARMARIIESIIVPGYKDPRQAARDIKEALDDDFDRNWHVIVGTDFACYMSFSPGFYMRASYRDLVIQVFRLA